MAKDQIEVGQRQHVLFYNCEALLNKAAVVKQVQILSNSSKASNQVAVKEIPKVHRVQYSITALILGFMCATIIMLIMFNYVKTNGTFYFFLAYNLFSLKKRRSTRKTTVLPNVSCYALKNSFQAGLLH